MELFRATKDISPAEINHRWVGDAVYGKGTYFALKREVAERYLTPSSKVKVLFHYNCEPKNTLVLSSEDIPRLKHFVSDETLTVTDSFARKLNKDTTEIQSPDLCNLAQEAGYDSIILRGEVEGGEQLIIPEGSNLEVFPTFVEVTVFIKQVNQEKVRDRLWNS